MFNAVSLLVLCAFLRISTTFQITAIVRCAHKVPRFVTRCRAPPIYDPPLHALTATALCRDVLFLSLS
jgi:hypothetical protein